MTTLDLHRFSSLQDAFNAFLPLHGNRTAMIEADRNREKVRLTYAEVNDLARTFASALQNQTNKKDFRLGIIMSNQSKWLVSAIANFYAGGILVPLDYKLTPEEQLKLIAHSNIDFLVIEYPFWKRIKTADTQNILSSVQIFVTEAPVKEDLDAGRWEQMKMIASPPFVMASSKREDVACIVYSSGTGGTPKGCMLTHGNYLSQAQSLSELYPIGQDDTYFSFIPTNHAIDFMCGFLLPLFFGSKIVHQRTLRPEFFTSTMQTYKVSHMALVPLLLKTLEQKIKEKTTELPIVKKILATLLISINALVTKHRPWFSFSNFILRPIHETFGGNLRLIFAGGAFVENSTARFFYNLGIPVVIGYGLTEAGTVLTVNDLKPFRGDTVGKPLPITSVKIHNPDEHGVGEVWVSGPTVMKGYLNEPELTRETMDGKWLKTGDLGKIDHKHLVLLGRKKNMIVTQGGKNVYPEDIETSFDRINGVDEYCILAKRLIWPSENLTNDSMILIVKPGENAQSTEILNEIRNRNRSLSDYKRVSQLLMWNESFSRTASMKIKRHELADDIIQTIKLSDSKLVNL